MCIRQPPVCVLLYSDRMTCDVCFLLQCYAVYLSGQPCQVRPGQVSLALLTVPVLFCNEVLSLCGALLKPQALISLHTVEATWGRKMEASYVFIFLYVDVGAPLDYTVCLHASMHLNCLCSYALDVYRSVWPDSDWCVPDLDLEDFHFPSYSGQVRLTTLHRILCCLTEDFILNAENDLKRILKYTEGHGGI